MTKNNSKAISSKKDKEVRTKKPIKKANSGPKKPTTAFFCYLKDRRQKLHNEQPNIKYTDLLGKLAEEWRKLGEEEKKKYLKLAEDDRKRYKKELQAFKSKKKTKSKVKKDESTIYESESN